MKSFVHQVFFSSVPDMQPITFLIPRAFMVLTMFLVPSDIMVVGPDNVMTSQD